MLDLSYFSKGRIFVRMYVLYQLFFVILALFTDAIYIISEKLCGIKGTKIVRGACRTCIQLVIAT